MKRIFAATFLLTLGACQLTPNQAEVFQDALETAVTVLDRDGDGQITNREVKDSGGNVGLYGAGLALLMSLFGVTRSNSAHQTAQAAQTGVNELYDVTYKPVSG